MAAFWPTSSEPFAAPMNQIPKVVFSRRGLPASENAETEATRALVDARARAPRSRAEASPAHKTWADAHVVTGEVGAEIIALKHEQGADILAHGGARFAQSLIERGLVDELRLLVHPVALGRGLPLFSRLARPLDLKLVESKAFHSGAVAHIYQPAA
jgi:dihydrofolate reductase